MKASWTILTGRQTWIDICRGIGILIVVLGHANPPFKKFIYGFHMPFFFLLSGYLLSDRKLSLPFRGFVKVQASSYVVPYILLCIVNLFFHAGILFIKGELSLQRFIKYIIGILYSRGTVEWMPNCTPLWFLTALFVAMLMYYWINKLHERNKIIGFTMIAFAALVSWILDIKNIPKLPWNIDTAMMALMYIHIGRYLFHEAWFENEINRGWKGILFIFILLIVGSVGIIANPIDSVNFDNNYYGNIALMFLGSVGIGGVIMVFFHMCRWLWRHLVGKFLEFVGKHTVFIMGFDYFSSTVGGKILGRLSLYHWTTLFLFKIFILLAGLFLWQFIINKLPATIARRLDY